MPKSYRELRKLKTFKDRYEYLMLAGNVGMETFGYDRYLNQRLYKSARWRSVRDKVIIRDNGCDLGIDGHEIHDTILVHHINPITANDIRFNADCIYDMDNLVCTRLSTHNGVHYCSEFIDEIPEERRPNDTTPWKSTK